MRLLLCPQKVTIVSVRQVGMRAAPHTRHRTFDILSIHDPKSQCRYVGKTIHAIAAAIFVVGRQRRPDLENNLRRLSLPFDRAKARFKDG
jgi:hypothetical protein